MTRDEADQQLAKAISDHAAAYGLQRGDEFLDHYAVVAQWVEVDDDNKTYYTTHFHRSPCPHHIAVGLLHAGLSCVNDSDGFQRAGDEEDDS